MTELYILHMDRFLSKWERHMFMSTVSDSFRARILMFRHEEDLQRSLMGNILTRSILSTKTGISNENLVFKTDSFGKPRLEPELLHFNVSHSGLWVCLAVASEPVGVDVEMIVPLEISDAAVAMNTREIRFLESQPEEARLKQLYSIWTARESYVKYLGTGLSAPPEVFSISLESTKPVLVCTAPENVPCLHLYETADGSPVTLCAECPDPPTPKVCRLSECTEAMLKVLCDKSWSNAP